MYDLPKGQTLLPQDDARHEPELLPHETYKALTDLWSHFMGEATDVRWAPHVQTGYLDAAARVEKILGPRACEILGAHRARVESRR